VDIGLLVLRVTVGVLLVGHGTQKLFGPLGAGAGRRRPGIRHRSRPGHCGRRLMVDTG
jgi:uncharacterized membrane protein YphA (DoxX/SURF4 family)